MLGYELHPYKCFTPIQHTKDILEPNIFLQTKTFETFPPCPPCVHCYVPYVPCVAGGKWPCWAVPCGASTRSWDVWCESLEAEIPWVKNVLPSMVVIYWVDFWTCLKGFGSYKCLYHQFRWIQMVGSDLYIYIEISI